MTLKPQQIVLLCCIKLLSFCQPVHEKQRNFYMKYSSEIRVLEWKFHALISTRLHFSA